jgi:hypothetical protein
MQTRVFDFAAKDLTDLLNLQDAYMLPAGVYFGYNLARGTNPRDINITMDQDPNVSGGVIGVLHTRDGVTIMEDASLPPLTVTAASTDDRYDAVVAVYAKNDTRPVNVCSYTIRQGVPGTTAFVNLVDGSAVPSIKVETFTTSDKFNGFIVKTSPGSSSGIKIQVLEPDTQTVVETFDNILRAGVVAAVNNVSEYIWVTVLTAGSPGEPAPGQTLTFSGGVSPLINDVSPLDYELGRVLVRKNQTQIFANDVLNVNKIVFRKVSDDQYVFNGVMASGAIKGAILSPGSTNLKATLSSGLLISTHGRAVLLPGGADRFLMVAPTANSTAQRYHYYVGYRSYFEDEGLGDASGPVFFAVAGNAVSYAASAATDYPEPTRGQVLAVLSQQNLDLRTFSQVYLLGTQDVAKDGSGTILSFPPVTTGRQMEPHYLEVPDSLTSMDVSGTFSGWSGLRQLMATLLSLEAATPAAYGIKQLEYEQLSRPLQIKLRGLFFADSKIRVPAWMSINGPATVWSLLTSPFEVAGYFAAYDGTNPVWTAVNDPDQSNVPGGSIRKLLTLQSTYLASSLADLGLNRNGSSAAMVTLWRSTGGPTNLVIPARPAVVVNSTQLSIVMTTAELGIIDPNTVSDGSIAIRKSHCGLVDIHMVPGISGAANVSIATVDNFVGKGLYCDAFVAVDMIDSTVDDVSCSAYDSALSFVAPPVPGYISWGNRYSKITVRDTAANHVFGYNEENSVYDNLRFFSSSADRVTPPTGPGLVAMLLGDTNTYRHIDCLGTIQQESLATGGTGSTAHPISPFSVSIYAPGSSKPLMTDDGLGNLRVPSAGNNGTIGGSVTYSSGAYVITSPIAGMLVIYATGGVVVHLGNVCDISHVSGAMAVDTGTTNSTFRDCALLIVRSGATADVLGTGTTLYLGTESLTHVATRTRARSGTANYNGLTGQPIVFSKVMPDGNYRLKIETTSDVSNGVLGDVYVLNKTATGFVVYNTGWNSGDGFDPGPKSFDWEAHYIEGLTS